MYAVGTGVFVLIIGLMFTPEVMQIVSERAPNAAWVPFFYDWWVIFTGVGLISGGVYLVGRRAVYQVLPARKADLPKPSA